MRNDHNNHNNNENDNNNDNDNNNNNDNNNTNLLLDSKMQKRHQVLSTVIHGSSFIT